MEDGKIVRNSQKGKAFGELLELSVDYMELMAEYHRKVQANLIDPRLFEQIYSRIFVEVLPKLKSGNPKYDNTSTVRMQRLVRSAQKHIEKARILITISYSRRAS
jgi:hypothetical protein